MDRTSQTVTLKGGRKLGYAEYGAPEGRPVFYFHGFPSSRVDWPLFDTDETATRLDYLHLSCDPGNSERGKFCRR